MRLAMLVLSLAGSVAVAQPRQKIAILGLEVVQGAVSSKDAVKVAEDFTNTLRARAKTGTPYSFAPNSDRELVEEKLLDDCLDEAPKCMAKIGANLAADVLMYGKIEPKSLGGNAVYQISVKLFDVTKQKMVIGWTDAIPAADANGTKLAELAKKGYERMVGNSPGKPSPTPPTPPTPLAPSAPPKPTGCDFDGLVEKAKAQVSMGTFAAALAGFEQAYKCRAEAKLVPLMFMASCKARMVAKAKLYFGKMTAQQQQQFAQFCLRQAIDPAPRD